MEDDSKQQSHSFLKREAMHKRPILLVCSWGVYTLAVFGWLAFMNARSHLANIICGFGL